MASEDPDQFGPGFVSVHGSDHLDDACKAVVAEVLIVRHLFHAGGEFLEVLPLGSSQGMLPEERNDHADQVLSPANHISVQRLTVIVVSTVHQDHPYTEEILQVPQALQAPFTLRHDELMEHLISRSVADPAVAARLPHQAEGEASFSIHKAENPAQLDESFLLIVRTHRIVTVARKQPQ